MKALLRASTPPLFHLHNKRFFGNRDRLRAVWPLAFGKESKDRSLMMDDEDFDIDDYFWWLFE